MIFCMMYTKKTKTEISTHGQVVCQSAQVLSVTVLSGTGLFVQIYEYIVETDRVNIALSSRQLSDVQLIRQEDFVFVMGRT